MLLQIKINPIGYKYKNLKTITRKKYTKQWLYCI